MLSMYWHAQHLLPGSQNVMWWAGKLLLKRPIQDFALTGPPFPLNLWRKIPSSGSATRLESPLDSIFSVSPSSAEQRSVICVKLMTFSANRDLSFYSNPNWILVRWRSANCMERLLFLVWPLHRDQHGMKVSWELIVFFSRTIFQGKFLENQPSKRDQYTKQFNVGIQPILS